MKYAAISGKYNLAQYSTRTISGKEGVYLEMQHIFHKCGMLKVIIERAIPAVSHRVKMAGQRARFTVAEVLQQILQDSESELSDVVSILMLMMIIYPLKEEISF